MQKLLSLTYRIALLYHRIYPRYKTKIHHILMIFRFVCNKNKHVKEKVVRNEKIDYAPSREKRTLNIMACRRRYFPSAHIFI